MTTLLLTLCLGTQCHSQPYAMPDAMSCVLRAQVIAAEWVEAHPGGSVQGWRCVAGDGGRAL